MRGNDGPTDLDVVRELPSTWRGGSSVVDRAADADPVAVGVGDHEFPQPVIHVLDRADIGSPGW